VSGFSTAEVATQVADRQEQALDAFLETLYRQFPVTASFAGEEKHDAVLPDFSPEGLKSARSELTALRRRLADAGLGVLHDEELRVRDWPAIDGALADAALELLLAEDETRHFVRGNPSIAIGEALFSLVALASREDGALERRVGAAIARLKAFPDFLHGARRTLGEGGVPATWRSRAMRECDGGLLLLDDLAGWPVAGGAPVALCRELKNALEQARAAVEWFRAWLGQVPDAPHSRYAVGTGALSLMVRRGHWCDIAVERLRHEARAALERETWHLRDALRGESWLDVAERIASRHPDVNDVLPVARATWQKCRELANAEVSWPDGPLPYEPMPAWARQAAPYLYYLPYRSPPPLLGGVGHYDVLIPEGSDASASTAFPRLWSDAAIKLNHVAHHGGLGHHVQNWHAARSRSRVGQIAAVDGASRIALFCGGTMAEGWACYATEIMESLGFLTDDERISEQHTRVRLMTRAVVDLELHTGRMSFDDAVQFHVEAASQSPHVAAAEVTKCSMFPGTAMMYWLGVRELWRIRHAEESARGSSFDVRAFHDELLSFGSVPVTLAGKLMRMGRAAG
jgi:hypothetical protein